MSVQKHQTLAIAWTVKLQLGLASHLEREARHDGDERGSDGHGRLCVTPQHFLQHQPQVRRALRRPGLPLRALRAQRACARSGAAVTRITHHAPSSIAA